MNNKEFNTVLNYRIEQIAEVLGKKAEEYALDGDRLYNFKRASSISGQTNKLALWGMAMKHLVSVTDLVEGKLPNTEHNTNEKIGDFINYLILLEALMAEERSL